MKLISTKSAAAIASVLTLLALPTASLAAVHSPGATVCRKSGASPAGIAPATLKLGMIGSFKYGHRQYTAFGEGLRLHGKVVWDGGPVAGEPLRVRVYVGSRQVRSATVTVKGVGCGLGTIDYRFKVWRAGRVRVKLEALPRSRAHGVLAPSIAGTFSGLTAYKRASGPGSRGTGVGVLLAMLRQLGYYAPYGSTYGPGTGKAVLAYRKVNHMTRIETPSARIYDLLQQGRGAIRARYPRMGVHLEADLSKQVLTFFHGSKPIEVHPISSGKPSTPTVLGKYQFYMKDPGTNSHGMVFSSYFHNGYAVHGYVELPTYPASHGCLRAWVPSAVHIYNQIRTGEWIAVFW